MPGRFTDRVKKVLQYAREEAKALNSENVGTEHVLLGIVREGAGVAAAALKALGVDLENLARNIENSISSSGGMMTIGSSSQLVPGLLRLKSRLPQGLKEFWNSLGMRLDSSGTIILERNT